MLTFTTMVTVRKIGSHPGKPWREEFSDQEVELLTQDITGDINLGLSEFSDTLLIQAEKLKLVLPTRSVDDIEVPLADLRTAIAKQQQNGISNLKLTDLLILIRSVYRNSNEVAES